MSGNIKILLAVLALGALVSGWYLSTVLNPESGTATIFDASGIASRSQGYSVNQDSDRDGLSDLQEAYWNTDPANADSDGDGFQDGEEVVSGHDPVKKGPNDLLDEKANLTEKASALLIGGVIAGDLQPNSPQYAKSIQTLVDDVFEQYAANTAFEADSFKKAANTRDALITYGFSMSRLMQSVFADTTAGYGVMIETIKSTPISELSTLAKTDPAAYRRFTAAIDAELSALDARITKVKAIAVPPSMQDASRNVLILLRGAQQQYRLLRAIARDPLQGLVAFQVLNTLATQSPLEITHDFAGRLSQALANYR